MSPTQEGPFERSWISQSPPAGPDLPGASFKPTGSLLVLVRCLVRYWFLAMLAAREAAAVSPGGRHETITLQTETTTPRARPLSASFVRERTPPGELPPARRQRMKNEGKARARALVRLDPVGHERYLVAERARKADAALRAERGEHVVRRARKFWANAGPPSPPWKQQARGRVAAEAAEAQERRDARATRAQEARIQRAAMTGSHRCGSCATCAELEMFGGTLWVKHGKPCETVLQQLCCAEQV